MLTKASLGLCLALVLVLTVNLALGADAGAYSLRCDLGPTPSVESKTEPRNCNQCPDVTELKNEVQDLNDQATKTNGAVASLSDQVQALKKQVDKKTTATPYPHNGYSYTLTRLTRSWYDSRAHCQAIGGDLAAVGMRNYTVRRMVTSFLEVEHEHLVWVGAYDFQTEASWRWVDGSLLSAVTAQWVEGEPNSDGNEDCAAIGPHFNQDRLLDIGCSEQYLAICEHKLPE